MGGGEILPPSPLFWSEQAFFSWHSRLWPSGDLWDDKLFSRSYRQDSERQSGSLDVSIAGRLQKKAEYSRVAEILPFSLFAAALPSHRFTHLTLRTLVCCTLSLERSPFQYSLYFITRDPIHKIYAWVGSQAWPAIRADQIPHLPTSHLPVFLLSPYLTPSAPCCLRFLPCSETPLVVSACDSKRLNWSPDCTLEGKFCILAFI